MANLAIKGHKTRGKEVIEILEMLGGNNPHEYVADSDCFYFYIGDETRNIYYDWFCNFDGKDVTIFTLEEFLEKFPYKVGDKVIDIKTNRIVEIYKAHWSESNNCTYYDVKLCNNTGYVRSYKFLQPYKEETMEEIIKIDIPKGYEFAGVDDDNQQVVFEKIGYQYPKTYEECCEVLLLKPERATYSISGLEYKRHLIVNLQRLLICRDAYWKIAGEQMGFGKSWEPDWSSISDKHCIYVVSKNIWLKDCQTRQCTFAFPTEEMRDAFYENFKDLIEQCKELL